MVTMGVQSRYAVYETKNKTKARGVQWSIASDVDMVVAYGFKS